MHTDQINTEIDHEEPTFDWSAADVVVANFDAIVAEWEHAPADIVHVSVNEDGTTSIGHIPPEAVARFYVGLSPQMVGKVEAPLGAGNVRVHLLGGGKSDIVDVLVWNDGEVAS